VQRLDTHHGLFASGIFEVTSDKYPFDSETMMRFYNQPHRFYCGVDLHADPWISVWCSDTLTP
jgi:hypothetical protein